MPQNDNTKTKEKTMTKKEKIASILICISLILLMVSSIYTVCSLKIKNNNLIQELIKKY